MQKSKSLIVLVLFSILSISCGEDHKEVSVSEFTNTVLPEIEINNVEAMTETNEIIIYTVEEDTYKVNLGTMDPIEKHELMNEIKVKNPGVTETYVLESNELFSPFLIFQALYLIIPILILTHIILLWIALKKIIRSQIESTEKLVYTIITIFFPVFGSIIYLTTGKR